ncbi:MAG: signal peptidase II [Clostridia bacterium]|nr:signal peptidase II [Clostridia bacterium]
MKTRTKYIIMACIIAVALAIDLISKQVFSNISYTRIIPYIIAFQTNGGNTGAAFGIFSKSTTFLIVISIVIVLCLIFVDLMLKINTKTYSVGFGLIMAGAIGNFVDRIMLGYVRDFIMFDFWHSFPIFNFADCCIVIGAILVCVHFIFLSKSRNTTSNKDEKADKNGTN